MGLFLKRSLLLLCVILMQGVSHAQNGNPFELGYKASQDQNWEVAEDSQLPVAIPSEDTTALLNEEEVIPAFESGQIEGNPFEISGDNPKHTVDPIKAAPVIQKIPNKPLSEGLKAKVDQFKMILSLILLISLALISTLLRHVIIKVVEGFKSDNLLRTYFRSTGRRVSLPNMLLEAFFVVNAAFTCFLLAEHFDTLLGKPIIEYLKILLAVAAVVYGKHLILFIIREVFPIHKEVGEYNFTINLFLSILGLVLLPCNLILGFATGGMVTLMLYFIGLTFALVIGYLGFRGLIIGSKFLSSNRFHFFMYLCTVEIAPLFILVKVIKNYLGS